MTEEKFSFRRAAAYAAAGGLLGIVIFGTLFGWLNGVFLGKFVLINQNLENLAGNGAAAIELGLYFLLGAIIGLAALPFAADGRSLVLRSLAHYLAVAATVSAIILLFGWAGGEMGWQGFILIQALVAAVYVIIWVSRWIGWLDDVRSIRKKLGIEPRQSKLLIKESAPYLALAAAVIFTAVPIGFYVDILGIVGLVIVPAAVMPAVGFFPAFSIARRYGFAPIYPAATVALYAAAYLITRLALGLNIAGVWPLFLIPGVFACIGGAVGRAVNS